MINVPEANKLFIIKVRKGEFGWSRKTNSHLYTELFSITNHLGETMDSFCPRSFKTFLKTEAKGIGSVKAEKIMNTVREMGADVFELEFGKKPYFDSYAWHKSHYY